MTSTIGSVTLAAVALTNATVLTSSTEGSPSIEMKPSEPIFLQTKLAQGIAGLFVWLAMFITCQQVRLLSAERTSIERVFASRGEFSFPDISALEVVHEPCRAEVDRENPVHRSHIRNILVDQPVVLQLRELLHLLFYRQRLLRR